VRYLSSLTLTLTLTDTLSLTLTLNLTFDVAGIVLLQSHHKNVSKSIIYFILSFILSKYYKNGKNGIFEHANGFEEGGRIQQEVA